MIFEALLFEGEQMDEPVAGHLMLYEAQDEVCRGDRRLDSEQLEVVVVARVVHAGDDPFAKILLLRDLTDEHVVLVIARDGDHEVSPLDAGPLEHPQLSRVAILDGVLELLLEQEVALPAALDQSHLMTLRDQLAPEVSADLAGADDDHIHDYACCSPTACSNIAIACSAGEIV